MGFGPGILSFKIVKKFLEMLTLQIVVSGNSLLMRFQLIVYARSLSEDN
jgi:hypothetical protein